MLELDWDSPNCAVQIEDGGCLVAVAQWQNTGCTSQVSWVQFPVTAGLFTFFYFQLKISLSLSILGCLGETHIDDILGIPLLNVVENGSLMEISEGCHVIHPLHTGVVHHHDMVMGEFWAGESSLLKGGGEEGVGGGERGWEEQVEGNVKFPPISSKSRTIIYSWTVKNLAMYIERVATFFLAVRPVPIME